MSRIYPIYKQRTETPLEAIEHFRHDGICDPEGRLTYLGRLDPMAEGLLLVGENVTEGEREKYLCLDKTYRVLFMLGVETDTGDVLGKITSQKKVDMSLENIKIQAINIIEKFKLITEMEYHPFSSKPISVEGKQIPLFDATKKNHTENIPIKKVSITKADFLDIYSVDSSKIIEKIINDIKKVKGDFRQDEIISLWNMYVSFLLENKIEQITMIEVEISCSSGTYMRNLAHIISHEMGIPTLAYCITRTAVGEFALSSKVRYSSGDSQSHRLKMFTTQYIK